MTRFEKEPPDSDDAPFDCFVCGKPMQTTLGMKTRHCFRCDVTELRQTTPYIPMVRTITHLTLGDGEVITFIDHSTVHMPSPA